MEFNDFSKSQSKESDSKVEETGPSLLIKKWLSNEDVCKLLGVSKRTLQNYRDQRLISFSQVGRKIFYRSSSVDTLLEQHHVRSNYEKGGVL